MMNGAHYDDADAQTADEPTELADRHDGVSATREQIQATFEYEVTVAEEQIDDLPPNMDAAEFAENIAASRMNKELDPTFRIGAGDAVASETENFHETDERVYTVFVRVSQND
jgi:hypothetical protein